MLSGFSPIRRMTSSFVKKFPTYRRPSFPALEPLLSRLRLELRNQVQRRLFQGKAMSITTVNDFLDLVRGRLSDSNARITLVSGNDSADLDSIVSALLFAYLSQRNERDTSVLYVPLVKVPACDLALRPEVEFVFSVAGIDVAKLVCIDHVDVSHAQAIVLVDHNRLTPPFKADDEKRVVGVLDHHVDERRYLDAPLREIEMVGSCTSLIVRHFKDSIPSEKPVSRLALGPIMVDTIGLRWEYGKTTQVDVEAFERVKNDWTMSDAEKFYREIEAVKSNVSHLSSRDLLRKDYKEFFVHGFRVGTSSVPWHFKGWFARDGGAESVVQAAMDYIKERALDLEVILTSYDHTSEGGQYERELGIFVANPRLLQVKQTLEADRNIDLSPLSPQQQSERVGFYRQGNVKTSRKQVWPLIQSVLETTQ